MKLKMRVKRHGEGYSAASYSLDLHVSSTSNTFIRDVAAAVDNVVKMHFPDLTSTERNRDIERGSLFVREAQEKGN